ncbi:MAG: hypothetical protein ACE5E5_12095 [Phycisphaerae bacterium]
MSGNGGEQHLASELLEQLAPRFPGIDVRVAHSDRWNRPCATFCWDGFAGLLPEERFQRLATVLPEDFRASRMHGVVWMELAPGESVEAFLKLPRSEDLGDREEEIYRRLSKGGFFDLLAKRLGTAPKRSCGGDFRETASAIKRGKSIDVSLIDAKLVFIRRGVFCDCQVLQGAQPALAKRYAGAA